MKKINFIFQIINLYLFIDMNPDNIFLKEKDIMNALFIFNEFYPLLFKIFLFVSFKVSLENLYSTMNLLLIYLLSLAEKGDRFMKTVCSSYAVCPS